MKLKMVIENKKLQSRSKKYKFFILLLVFSFSLLTFTGCAKENAQEYALQSQAYYERSVNAYKNLLKGKTDLDELHFQLGQLYFSHGEFLKATREFKESSLPEARKFLAISYYQSGNFTDALEEFNKNAGLDDECRYYQGLTAEKLNLFDQALEIYRKIKSPQFKPLSLARENIIEKRVNPVLIKDLEPRVNKIIEEAPAAENYPQAGALVLSCEEEVETTPEDTQVSTLHYLIKILNQRGKEDFSEAHIDYDSTYEKIELDYARTIKPDGTVTDVGTRHIRDVSKYLNFPLYSNARVYIISFPEIAEGSVIEYKLKIYRNQLINKKDFALDYPLQTQAPVLFASFRLSIPENLTLRIKELNEKYNNFSANLKPLVEKNNKRLVYRWEFKNIPQILPETGMPAAVQINPTLLFSTFDSWEEIYKWWWDLAKDKIKADNGIKEKVKNLTAKLKTQEDKIKAVHNFCAKDIRYVAVEYGQAGYEPHRAEDTFKNKYGDCKDKAILLVTMLKEIGVSAFPVLISTRDYYNLSKDFPSMMFNHCIAAVRMNEKIIFIDPTAETCSFGDLPADDQNRRVLMFPESGYSIADTPLYPAEHNLIRQEAQVKITADENVVAKKTISSLGIYDQAQRYWLVYTPPQLVEESLKEKIQEFSIGAKLNSYSIDNLDDLNFPVVLNYEFTGNEYFTEAGDLRIMPQLSRLDTGFIAKERRNYPIDFNILDSKETVYVIEIPKNFTVKYLPDSITRDSKWVKFISEYAQKNNRLYFSQRIDAKVSLINQDEYSDFKNFFESLVKETKQRIVLEKKK